MTIVIGADLWVAAGVAVEVGVDLPEIAMRLTFLGELGTWSRARGRPN